MKLIKLTQGRVAIVDDEDFEWLSQWEWYYSRGSRGKTGYALRMSRGPHQQRRGIHLSVAIIERHGYQKHGKEIGHINTCGCDNRKENLRFVTRHEQEANKRIRSDNTSGVRGVCWDKRHHKWHARIKTKEKHLHLGYFPDKKNAIAARRKAEIKYFGEYRHDPKLLCPLWKTGQCPDCAERARELGLKP